VEGVSVLVLVSQLLSAGLNVVAVVKKNELVLGLTAGVVAAVDVVSAGLICALVLMVLLNTRCLVVVLHVPAMHHPPQHTPPHVPNNHCQHQCPLVLSIPTIDSQ